MILKENEHLPDNNTSADEGLVLKKNGVLKYI